MKKDNEPLSLEDYKAFFETLGKNVISSATNMKGDIIYVNDKFVEVSKYDREELLGQNHRIVKSGFHPQEFYKALWKTISSGQVWRGEIKNKAKDSSYYWVDTSIAPILGPNEKPVKYVSVRFLITDQKNAEAEVAGQRTKEMERLSELEKFQKITVGRELKMVELKKEIADLKKKIGESV